MTSRKYALILFLIFFVACPSIVLAKEDRGIAVTSAGQSPGPGWGNYHALIIGINAYKEWNPLQTAVKDAQELRDILIKRYGFANKNVVLRTDEKATRHRIIRDLRNMAANLDKTDNLLVYYAGHGQLDDFTGGGYWIPVEGKLDDPSTWVSQDTIKSILSSEKVRGKNIVVVADSCYSGTMLRGGPSLLPLDDLGYFKKLEKAAARRSRQVITSGGVEPVDDGGKDGHSLFAYYLLKALRDNEREVIDIENLFHTRVWEYVTEIGDQRPNVGRLKTPMDDGGQFVLVDKQSQVQNLVLQKRKKQERERLMALMAEKEKLEVEKMRLEAEKQLLKEKKRLEAERRQLEEEKKKIAKAKSLAESSRLETERFQNKQAAYIPKGHSQVPSDNRLTLAIFPSKNFDLLENSIIVGLKEAIIDLQLFFVEWSYYDLGYRFKIKRLGAKTFPENIIKNLWIKESFFSTPKPNVELICQIGKELQVDSILLYYCVGEIHTNMGPRLSNVNAFLINVKTKTVYSENMAGDWGVETASLSKDLKILTEKVFNSFAKDKK